MIITLANTVFPAAEGCIVHVNELLVSELAYNEFATSEPLIVFDTIQLYVYGDTPPAKDVENVTVCPASNTPLVLCEIEGNVIISNGGIVP